MFLCLLYVIKVYGNYSFTLKHFIADLIACSTCFGHHYAHHQELKSIIQWLLPMVFKLLVWCGAEGCVWFAGCCSILQIGHMMGIVVPETC